MARDLPHSQKKFPQFQNYFSILFKEIRLTDKVILLKVVGR